MNPERLIGAFFLIYGGIQFMLRGHVYMNSPEDISEFENKSRTGSWWQKSEDLYEYNPDHKPFLEGCGVAFWLFGIILISLGLLIGVGVIPINV